MIRAVIFDFGRVISAQKPASLFCRYEEDLGLAPGVLNQVMFGSQSWKEVLVGRKSVEEYWREIAPKLGLKTEEALGAFRRRYAADEAINEGVADLIRTLHGQFMLAVLSNAPPGLERWLHDWGIREFFDVVICSGDEGVAKPDPAVFEITLKRLSVAAAEAVFIDDSPGHVQAARDLGLRGVQFTTADALVEELDGILGLEL